MDLKSLCLGVSSAALCLVSTGCGSPRGAYTPEPVLCVNAAQCNAMWSRAQLFVVQKSGFKLQTVTDSVIQTYGPTKDVWLAFTITRETASDGSGSINMLASCGNIFGCVPAPTAAARDFFNYVSQAK